MDTSELLKRLNKYVSNNKVETWRGQLTLAKYLQNWFKRKFNNHSDADVVAYLSSYLLDAVENLRTSDEADVRAIRQEILSGLDLSSFPKMTAISNGGVEINFVAKVAYLMGDICDDQKVAKAILRDYFSEHLVFGQKMIEFNRMAWNNGMLQIATQVVMHNPQMAEIGDIQIHLYNNGQAILLDIIQAKQRLVLLAAYADSNFKSIGNRKVKTDLATALKLLDTVINNWPNEPSKQQKLFKDFH